MPRSRIYSEMLPYEEVLRPRTIALLRRYALELVLAVRPWQLEGLARVATTLRDEGIPLSVWPMVEDDEGRWANAGNAERFVAFVRDVCDELDAAGTPARDVLLDMEPSFSGVRELRGVRALGLLRPARGVTEAFVRAERVYARAVTELRSRGITTSCAVWPLVALDPPSGRGWQSLLGTPVDALSADHVSVMMYTSIVSGWSGGAIRRSDALELLAGACARTVGRHGDRAGVSLGCIGTGAFGGEPVYATPAELAEDAAVARAAGASVIALFDLAGVLSRAPAEAWLDALVDESTALVGAPPRTSRRVAVARRIVRAATWALGRRRA